MSVAHAGAVFLRSLLRTAPRGRDGRSDGRRSPRKFLHQSVEYPSSNVLRVRAAIGKKYTGHSCADRLTCDQSIPRTRSRHMPTSPNSWRPIPDKFSPANWSVTAGAFVGTNPKDESITSGLPVNREAKNIRSFSFA